MRRVAALAAAPLILLGACDAGDRDHEGVVPTVPEEAGILEVEAGTIPADVGSGGDAAGDGDDAAGDGDDAAGEAAGGGPVDLDALFGTSTGVGGPYGEPRDGVWGIGPAGELEFAVTGPDALGLAGVRPAGGWVLVEQEASEDEIDVDLRRGPVTFEVQIEIDAGVLEIQIDHDIDPAQPGTFFVGEAATVTVSLEGGVLGLEEVMVNEGWVEVVRDIDSDDLEVEFQRAGTPYAESWEFTADLDDGVLEVHIDYEISGPYAG